ncbi:autotransporter domain-containing protein [Stenotrophomonas sp.]|uniref:autotransporter domain-containing protein n=1 Tax=Stenotrophomonas sp. TaxID=69392 RepID=UPI002FCCA442
MSAPHLVRPLLRAVLSLLLVLTAWSAQAAQVRFTTGSWGSGIAQAGEGGSQALPGLTLQVLNADAVPGGPAGTLSFQDNSFFATGLPSFPGALTDAQTEHLAMVIKSPSGRPFSLKSFLYMNWGENYGTQVRVDGFRGGISVSGATHVFAWPDYTPRTVSLPSSFDMVDEVRIQMVAGGTVNPDLRSWHAINDLVVEVPNSPPTDITLSSNTVAQSGAPNQAVGSLGSTDPDIGSTFTYALVAGPGDTDNAGFTIVGTTLRATNPSALAAGARSVRVRTTDEGGATYDRAFVLNVIDDLAPSVSSITVSGSPAATASSVTYVATFSESVTNVTASSFALTTVNGSAAGTLASVSGAGAVYSIVVNGISGNGGLRLDLASGSGITDLAGNGNLPAYTAGAVHTVAIPVAPGAPTIGAATPGVGQVSVAFTAPGSDGGSPITGYTATSSPGNFTATGTASPLVVTGLTNGTAYTFTVTATNAIGEGAASAASSAATPRATQSITFPNPGSQLFGTTPTLTASSSSGLPVVLSSSTTGVCTVDGGGTLGFISAGTCTIAADQAGNGAFAPASTVIASFTVNPVSPGAPTIGTATPGNTSASVSFTAPASNGGASITGYTVTALPGGITATGSGSPLIVTGLTNGVSYTFSVTATNSAGEGASSGASNAITPAAPQTITFGAPGSQNFGTTPTLSATSDSGLTPVFSSTTPAVCTISSGGLLAFVTAGTCSINADQPGDGSYLPAATVTRAFAVNAVAPGAPTIGTATPSGTGEIEVSFAAPAFSGGATITGYTVTSSPGAVAASGSASPIRVSGLTVGQSYTFTVTATNSAGTGGPSAASNAALAADAIGANPSSQAVPYGEATAVALDISGIPTSISVTALPTHGVLAISGLTATYTPNAGYAGPDTFTYRATDGNTTSAPALVSLTVGAPTVALAPASVPGGVAGTAYQQALASSGGTAPYSYQLLGTLPPGLSLAPNGEISGTPTTTGSFAFSVQTTDSSTGTGPFSATRAYTLVVTAPQIGFTLATLPDPYTATGYAQRLQVSGGEAPYSFVVSGGALPAGLTLATDGQLTGTPTAAGSYTFSVTVTDANGFTAQQSYTLVVIEATQQITAFVATPSAPVYSPDGRFSVAASGGASGNPVVFTTTTPAICRVEGSSVSMLSSGRCSLAANQAGNAQYQAAAQVLLEVDISAAIPVLQWPQALHKVYGEAAFDLADPQSPSRGAFSFASSAPGVASVQGRTVTLVGEGSTIITVTQAAAGGYAAGTAQLRLTVSQRPDPTRDPGVVAGVQAQVDASVRFASAQQSNIRDRLRQVRGGGNASSNQLALNFVGGQDRPSLSVPLSRLDPDTVPALPTGWGVWGAGSATFGSGDRRSSYDFHSDGLSIGVDHAVGEHLLLGVAGSLGRNDSSTDDDTSRVQANQRSLAAYGLWRSGEHLFMDAVIATGTLDFDTRRWSNEMDAYARGSRDGDQWFGSLAFGYEHRAAGMSLTSYGRVEASRTSLEAYREHGLDLYDLAYRRQVVRNSAVALGLEGAYQPADANSRVRPFWSVEYRQALEDKGDAYLNYVVGPRAQDYRLGLQSYNDNALSFAAGMDVSLQRGWLLSLLFGHEQTRGSSRGSSVGLRVSYGAGGTASEGGSASTLAAPATTDSTRCNPRRCPQGTPRAAPGH